MRVGFRITGMSSLRTALRNAGKQAEAALAATLYETATQTMDNAQQLVPVDTGELRDSRYVTQPVKDAGGLVVELGYGADHAPRVHEDLNAAHPKGGQAKFLEVPLLGINRQQFGKRVAAHFRAGAQSLPAGRHPTTPQGTP